MASQTDGGRKAGKGKGLANRTAIDHRSFAPSSVAEVGWSKVGGVEQKVSAG